MSPHVGELRADVDVQPLDVQPGVPRGADGLDGIVFVEAELGAAVPGANRLVRLRFDPRRDADEDATHAGGGSACRLVGRVEDDERAGLGSRAQFLVRLVVPVHEQALARDARPLREGELAECGDVRSEPLLGEQAHQRDVGEGLRPVDDERLRNGALEHSRAVAQRVLGVDHERRAEPLCQLGHGHSVELEHARRDPGSAREQC